MAVFLIIYMFAFNLHGKSSYVGPLENADFVREESHNFMR